MSTPTRITYVIPTMGVGGTELQLLRLMRALQGEFDISLVCLREGGALIGDVRRAGVDVRTVHARGGWDCTTVRQLTRLFRLRRPHVVHSFLSGFDLWANMAARRAGVPVVISSRRELAVWQKRRHLWLQRRANRYVDCIVANSRAVADFAARREHADPALFRVIYNGLNADDYMSHLDRRQLRKRYRIPSGATYVIGMVANFSPVKDHALFVEMATRLLSRRKDIHFLFVGAGPLLDSVHRMLLRRNMRQHFDRVITLNEMADVVAVLDVSVLCSKVEGFPNAVMEAMAAGKPVVAAAVGGIPELIQDRVTGRLVSTRAPEDFADAVESLLDNPEERATMGALAAAWVRENLAVERMVAAYRDLYRELLARARADDVLERR